MRGRLIAMLVTLTTMQVGAVQSSMAEKLQFEVTTAQNDVLQIHFYSETRQVSWPGPGRSYDLAGARTHNISIGCNPGEHICYGAWVKANPRVNWGVGLNKAHGCRGCCYYCDGGTIRISLRP